MEEVEQAEGLVELVSEGSHKAITDGRQQGVSRRSDQGRRPCCGAHAVRFGNVMYGSSAICLWAEADGSVMITFHSVAHRGDDESRLTQKTGRGAATDQGNGGKDVTQWRGS